MMELQNKYGIDTLKLLMKMTYLWLVMAIVAPGAYVAVAYLLSKGERPDAQSPPLETLFWLFLALSLVLIPTAYYLRKFLMRRPAILSEASFAPDFNKSVYSNFIIVTTLMESIALFGLLQFFLGADLQVVLLFAIISVIGNQLLRPRDKFVSDCLRIQEEHVAAGRFASG